MARSSGSKISDGAALAAPASAAAGLAAGGAAGAGNLNLGSLSPAARLRGRQQRLPVRAQLDTLYNDTIVVSEAARRWFDGPGRSWREELPPQPALAAAVECLGVTTRLLAVMNWLLQPAHEIDGAALLPVPCPMPPPLPADHPLHADEGGGPIVEASRNVLARAHSLASDHTLPSTHGDQP